MKTILFASACALVAPGAFGQGELQMSNANPIYDDTGNLLGSATGNQLTAELLEGASPSSLAPIPSSTCYVNQGYFYGPGLGGIVTIAGAQSNTFVDYAVEVWSTAAGSYANAQTTPGSYWGESAVNSYDMGPLGSLPIAPPPLNFASFNANLTTPEPATVALGAMSAGAMLLFRGRKQRPVRG